MSSILSEGTSVLAHRYRNAAPHNKPHRFCKANAETAHALSHWRYHLNEWVLDWLQNEGYTTAQKIVEREKWSIRKKRDYANEVVDTMEQKGEIRALYRDFKHNLEAAREAKVSVEFQMSSEDSGLCDAS